MCFPGAGVDKATIKRLPVERGPSGAMEDSKTGPDGMENNLHPDQQQPAALPTAGSSPAPAAHRRTLWKGLCDTPVCLCCIPPACGSA